MKKQSWFNLIVGLNLILWPTTFLLKKLYDNNMTVFDIKLDYDVFVDPEIYLHKMYGALLLLGILLLLGLPSSIRKRKQK